MQRCTASGKASCLFSPEVLAWCFLCSPAVVRLVEEESRQYDLLTHYSAYSYLDGSPRRMLQTAMFAGAGIVTSLIAPFTVVIMGKCNGRLHELAAKYRGNGKSEMSTSDLNEVEHLFAQWIKLNYLRACMPLIGSLMAALAPLTF